LVGALPHASRDANREITGLCLIHSSSTEWFGCNILLGLTSCSLGMEEKQKAESLVPKFQLESILNNGTL
jgi:hypothetical protein